MSDAPPGAELLIAFTEAYLRRAARLSLAELRRRQPPPYASVACGAAGVAYAFLRAHRASARASHLRQARRWARAAWSARGRADAFAGEGIRGRSGSVVFGRAGIELVAARVAGSRPRQLASWRPRKGAPTEFMQGLAGRLAAVTVLHEERADATLRELGDRLAGVLLEGAGARGLPSFAHGAAGVHHALLRWSLVTGFDLPDVFFASLEALPGAPLPPLEPELARSWCNGAAGLALAFVAATERTGRAGYLEAARRFAVEAAAEDGAYGSLCCGLAGRAYALLALERIDPVGTWRRRAWELAILAAQRPRSPHPNGLLKGSPGLVCLAIDLFEDVVPRFPLVEA
jgi:serine/threonine-protein kinase